MQIAWGRAMRAARKAHVYDKLREHLATAGCDEEAQDREVRAIEYKKRKPLQP